jgi:hypothetical protein
VVRVPGYRSVGPRFDSLALQEKKVVGMERGPLSLVSTTEELFGRNSSASGLESQEYDRRNADCGHGVFSFANLKLNGSYYEWLSCQIYTCALR